MRTKAPLYMDALAMAYLDEPCYVALFEQNAYGRGGFAYADFHSKIIEVKVGFDPQKTIRILFHEIYHAAIDVRLRDIEALDRDRRLIEEFRAEMAALGFALTEQQVKATLERIIWDRWQEGHEEREDKARAWAKAAHSALVEIVETEGRDPETLTVEEWCELGIKHTPLKEQLKRD